MSDLPTVVLDCDEPGLAVRVRHRCANPDACPWAVWMNNMPNAETLGGEA